jgi:cytochrome P450
VTREIGNYFATTKAVLVLPTAAQRFRLRLDPARPVEGFPAVALRPKNGVRMHLARR